MLYFWGNFNLQKKVISSSDEIWWIFSGIWKGKGVRTSSKGLHAMLKIEWQTTRWNWKTNAQIKANHNKLCLPSPCDEYIKSIFRKCYFYWRKPVYFLKKMLALMQNLMHFINRKKIANNGHSHRWQPTIPITFTTKW